jgi:DNA-binding IclR family transcriptional regulator
MVAIAVPVTDTAGRFVAALAFHGPTQRLNVESAIARREILQDAALKLREALFLGD